MTASPTSVAPPVPVVERWRPSAATVRVLALVALLSNVAIVATGGLVRLTDSGLGCPSWPDCTGSSLVPTRQLSWHKYVEFGNRLFTYVVLAAVVAALLGVVRAKPVRTDLRRWAWVTFAGVPAQAVMGGITVLTHLNPWAVAAHFVLSMALVAAATVLWWKARDVDSEPASPTASPAPAAQLLRRLGWGTWAVTYAVLCVGTVVTGSGPHAGDASAKRTGLRAGAVAQLHADLVMLLVGLAVALAIAVTAMNARRAAKLATRWLVVALAMQAVIGWTQYFTHLPIGLVEVHVVGAATVAIAATAVVLALGGDSRQRAN